MSNVKSFDCIVIGGGAAGLMCGATAGFRGRKTVVLDHANKVGKKILMSGGGRCNFTNYYVEADNYISENAHFCKSALSRYTQYDFIALVEKYGLQYHEKTQGQLFCDNKAQDILNILLGECEKSGVEINTHCQIVSVKQGDDGFLLETSQGQFACASLVIASGGLSIPTMGATGFGYDIAQQFGLPVRPRQASLVPYTFSDRWLEVSQQLAGVSLRVAITCGDSVFTDELLFTHRGVSGPAVLQISNYWHLGEAITVDFFPGFSLSEQIRSWRDAGNNAELKTLIPRISDKQVAKRFVTAWLGIYGGENKPVSQYTNSEIETIAQAFESWTVTPAGTEGYRTAEVTRGGVDTSAVSSKTFEAKGVQGLYFVGEVLDVTGWLGGFNFQWAWSSGWCAGQYV